ncbi:response regulator transcription factor [Sphingomonas donggukensis]|uniref:Response regulator transcription factor n=1 Tax=Sphingomonas donggukensis TaxID=2949093 RepID=A0ABY4TTW0_9SPHN|nr:response regulator transcription factor [Sphingomonas donggukensis]URW74862.1 response regulator transcription factor [Sphingomonas donggukensis]
MRILLAEDDVETAGYLARGLGELGHVVLFAGNGEDGLHLGATETVDVLVLDRMLPRIDGISVLRRLRLAGVATPALILTALGRIEDRVAGLDAGADDYLVKPFAFSELVARLNALARRAVPAQAVTRIDVGAVSMNLLTREVTRSGVPVPLQPREFRLLEELMRNADRFVTRTMLLERVWDFHFDPQTKIVETHMSRLRSKLNYGGLPDVIETVRGSGYRMIER